MNYGAIGFTIGHELTHAFDDNGRKYDGEVTTTSTSLKLLRAYAETTNIVFAYSQNLVFLNSKNNELFIQKIRRKKHKTNVQNLERRNLMEDIYNGSKFT